MLIDDIVHYLDYLKKECHLSISVHFRAERLATLPGEILLALIPYNRHESLYCMEVKRSRQGACVASQRAICEGTKEPHFRICHAGVKEYIHPVVEEDAVIGFIAVSGYREQNAMPPREAAALWEKMLSSDTFPLPLIEATVPPLTYMLKALFSRYAKGEMDEYCRLLTYLHEHRDDTTLEDLCLLLHRSRSYVSHLFNQRAGVTLRAYMNTLKLDDARTLLETTHLSVTEIAYTAGFSDTSYFIKLFKGKYGRSPLSYRKGI